MHSINKLQNYMKAIFYTIAFIFLSTGMISCNQTEGNKSESSDTAKTDQSPVSKLVEEIKPDLEFESEFALFKAKVMEQLKENDRKIDELKTRQKKENKKIQLKLQKQIDKFETENNTLKNKIDKSINMDKKAWENFKTEFNQDMDSLNKSISNIFD